MIDEEEEFKVYKPEELYFDVNLTKAWDDSDLVIVFLLDKETESDDCLGDHNVTGLPVYLSNQMENEWGADYNPEKTVEQVTQDMIAAGFEYKKLITWFD